ncbi:MAG: hypothetical protein IH846_06980 [Acidobacteria bacterium]|nr:hypothetical protein [Acidobacteriota bacterium]MCZ6751308.1 hypothetical protein [Acidobacteriota bacterium]
MELKIEVKINRFTELLERFPLALQRGIQRGLTRSTALLRRAVETNIRTPLGAKPPVVAFGVLANSVTAEVSQERTRAVGRVFVKAPADRYGVFVEFGTRPHRPPLNPLISWARIKFHMTDPKKIRATAWAVAEKIAKHGTQGHFMFGRAFQKNEKKVVSILEEEIQRSLP